MSIQKNVQIVKDFFAAMGGSDRQGLLALCAEDIEWIIPGEDWPLAGTYRGHAGLADLLQKASKNLETSFPNPPEFVAITVRNGKLTNIQEYVDRQALARASEMDASPRP
jgi:ketosteroid isomerase-like protein